jgi:hypothetical protein
MAPTQRPADPQDKKRNEDMQNGHSKSSKPSNKSSGGYVATALLAVVLAAYAYFQSPKAVSGSYALCSRDGNKIYTVDAHNSRTQCIVIHGSYIIDTGLLRAFADIKLLHKSINKVRCRGCSEALG